MFLAARRPDAIAKGNTEQNATVRHRSGSRIKGQSSIVGSLSKRFVIVSSSRLAMRQRLSPQISYNASIEHDKCGPTERTDTAPRSAGSSDPAAAPTAGLPRFQETYGPPSWLGQRPATARCHAVAPMQDFRLCGRYLLHTDDAPPGCHSSSKWSIGLPSSSMCMPCASSHCQSARKP